MPLHAYCERLDNTCCTINYTNGVVVGVSCVDFACGSCQAAQTIHTTQK
jgi:hypothetical protein